jgi:23S rRNA (uracil1939-C5)-methyltransferase
MNTRKGPPKTTKPFEIIIEKLVHGGAGIAHHKGKVVFVPYSVPGDRLLVRPVEEKRTFVKANIVEILKGGKGRAKPHCALFERCGGCHLQQLEYIRQVEAKRRILEETFHHRFPETTKLPIVMRACSLPFEYRSRARIQLRGTGAKASVGFFRCGSHTVEDVENCPLFRKSLNEALSSLRLFKQKVDTESKPYEMDIACSEDEGTWATARADAPVEEGVITLFGNRRGDDVILRRKVGEFRYAINASVFFQANDLMVPELVTLVEEAAKKAGQGSALDLFAGVGLFSLPLAKQFASVVSVENSPAATRLCSQNAKNAGLANIQAVCSDVLEWMESASVSRTAPFDLILLDPPRTGAGREIISRIREWSPGTIIYVSCDPQTLIRDLAGLSPDPYKISLIEGLDLFPQTYHFETVVLLEKQ